MTVRGSSQTPSAELEVQFPMGVTPAAWRARLSDASPHSIGVTPPFTIGGSVSRPGPRSDGEAGERQPGGRATISTVRHISLRVPHPGRTGAVSALVSYSQVTCTSLSGVILGGVL